MKKLAFIVSSIVLLAAVTGFSYTEISEYFQVARNNVNKSIKENISIATEIDRMEVILGKLDEQVSRQKYQVAKAQVALENAERELQAEQERLETYLGKMSKLRQVQQAAGGCETVKVACQRVTVGELHSALAYQLEQYKACQANCQEKEKLVAAQRSASATLTQKFNEWNQQRELLSQKLEVLRSRNEVQKANSELLADNSFDASELQRATELAGEVENRLAIVEKQQALGQDPIDAMLNGSTTAVDVTSEVDQLLADQQPEVELSQQ